MSVEYECVCDLCAEPVSLPIFDHVGDFIVAHGEREDSTACLCGYPFYLHCPQFLDDEDTISNMVVGGRGG